MDILTVSVIIISAVLLMMCCCILFIKIYGKGMFFGISITSVTVIGKGDDPEAILSNIIDSLGSEFEYSGSCLVIADGGMDENGLETCRKFCEKYGYMRLCKPDKLPEMLLNIHTNIY